MVLCQGRRKKREETKRRNTAAHRRSGQEEQKKATAKPTPLETKDVAPEGDEPRTPRGTGVLQQKEGGRACPRQASRSPAPDGKRRAPAGPNGLWGRSRLKMFRRTNNTNTTHEEQPLTGGPAESGESWLGRNRSEKRRLWERLNPRHRKELRLLAEALGMQQTHAHLPESTRARLDASVAELGRLTRRIEAILAEVARQTPPTG